MAQEIQTGKAVIYGITNSGTAITLSGFASFILDTTKAQHKFKLTDIQDESDFDTAAIAVNSHIEVDITWTPSGATRAAAIATAVFLPPLTKVTLADFAVDVFNGDYQYRGDGAIDLSHAAAKMTLKIRKYDDTEQNASLTTVVNG